MTDWEIEDIYPELGSELDYSDSAYSEDYVAYGTGGMIGEQLPDTEMSYQDLYGNSFSTAGV